MSLPEPGEFEAELERLGEEEVRKRLAYSAYSTGRTPLVEAWLRKKEEEKRVSIRKQEVEHKKTEIEIALSAKNAAWVAAVVAIISVIISVVALIISIKSD